MGRSTEKISRLAIIAALATGLLAGCSGQKEAAKPSPTIDESLKRYEAEFTPSDYDPEPGGRSTRSGTGTGEVPDTTTVEPSTPSSMEMVSGFRVQLIATTSIDEASAKKAEAEGMFPGEWVYVEYDPPTYKVRAGNFQSRVEADRFVKLASSRGFQDAWPVPQRVYKQPPSPQRPAPEGEKK